jgi:Serine/threonine protein phosphatase
MGTTLVALLPLHSMDTLHPRPPGSHTWATAAVTAFATAILRTAHPTTTLWSKNNSGAGQITPAQAAISPMRNLITRAIGSEPTVEAEIQSHHTQLGDLYLLATDGLSHELSDNEIEDILTAIPIPAAQPALIYACEALIAAANRNGGHDNITVLLVAIHPA